MQNPWSGTSTTVQATSTPRVPEKTHSLAIFTTSKAETDPAPKLIDASTNISALTKDIKDFLGKLKLAAGYNFKAVLVISKTFKPDATTEEVQALIAKASATMPFSLLVLDIDLEEALATKTIEALTAERVEKNNITVLARFKAIKESQTATDYVSEFKTAFDALTFNHLGIVLPFKNPSQLATLAGELCSIPIQQEPGWMGSKASPGVSLDKAFFLANQAQYKLAAENRAIVFKFHPEAPTQTKSNATFNLHNSTSTITDIPTSRVVNKLEDQIRSLTLPFINSHIFNIQDMAEQKHIEGTIQTGLSPMLASGELSAIQSIAVKFVKQGINIQYQVKPINYTRVITNNITISTS